MKKVLVLDNYDSFTYNLVHYIERHGEYEVHVFRNDEITLKAIDEYETIILSPGPGLPKDAGILTDLIKEYAESKKILGVCLGMQAIGEVFGGTLLNLSKVYHGVATPIKILDQTDNLFKNLPKTFNVGRYHSWILDNSCIPKELKVTSETPTKQVMSLKHKKYNLYGVQFHPESILTDYGKEIIDNFLEISL